MRRFTYLLMLLLPVSVLAEPDMELSMFCSVSNKSLMTHISSNGTIDGHPAITAAVFNGLSAESQASAIKSGYRIYEYACHDRAGGVLHKIRFTGEVDEFYNIHPLTQTEILELGYSRIWLPKKTEYLLRDFNPTLQFEDGFINRLDLVVALGATLLGECSVRLDARQNRYPEKTLLGGTERFQKIGCTARTINTNNPGEK